MLDDATLLPRALRLFWSRGFAGTGVRELEESFGLKAPSIYHRFGSKEALFRDVLAHYIDSVVKQRVERYLLSDDPLSGLRAFFDTTYDYISPRTPALGCLLVNTSLELGVHDAETRAELRRGSRMIGAALRRNLRRARARSELARDADIGALSDALHLGLQGLLVLSKLEHDKAVLRRRTDALFSVLPLYPNRKRSKP